MYVRCHCHCKQQTQEPLINNNFLRSTVECKTIRCTLYILDPLFFFKSAVVGPHQCIEYCSNRNSSLKFHSQSQFLGIRMANNNGIPIFYQNSIKANERKKIYWRKDNGYWIMMNAKTSNIIIITSLSSHLNKANQDIERERGKCLLNQIIMNI